MASKKEILSKIKIVLTQSFENQESAFDFFDKNKDGTLSRKEILKLLKKAKVNGFIRGLVAKKLISNFDKSKDKQIDWQEFKKAVKNM